MLPEHNDPGLWEHYAESALDYVALAEAANGPLPRPVGLSYVWGDLIELLDELRPDVRIVNLETAVTTSDDHWRGKGVHYRMHPGNVGCLAAAGIDVCVLANNHVLDWGPAGLRETLGTLRGAGIATAGAGSNREEAAAPAVAEIPGRGRVLVFAYGLPSSGIPAAWGYEIDPAERGFAHRLVAEGSADVVHGHSSHHPKGVEVFEDRLILYGCGDFLDDYEGIAGYEAFRGDLVLAYFVDLESRGRLSSAEMRPLRIRRFRLEAASAAEVEWLRVVLDREGARLGSAVRRSGPGHLALEWAQ